MSWYLANDKGVIDQFASISGLADLRRASQDQATLKDFFDDGETRNVATCIVELRKVAEHADADVKSTALGLAEMMEGEAAVSITQGWE